MPQDVHWIGPRVRRIIILIFAINDSPNEEEKHREPLVPFSHVDEVDRDS
jgi:hypothetical protein